MLTKDDRLHIRIPKDLGAKVRKYAKDRGVTVSSLIINSLRAEVEKDGPSDAEPL